MLRSNIAYTTIVRLAERFFGGNDRRVSTSRAEMSSRDSGVCRQRGEFLRLAVRLKTGRLPRQVGKGMT